ncbi:MAG: hypothetical protein M3Y87_08445 [Myxococcota bacterium]|nr:hypothetical protein [Myxococcota bacterium]
MHNTVPLKRAFGLDHGTLIDETATVEALSRVDPVRVAQPVEVTWTGRRSDVIPAMVGFRSDDILVSDALYVRLEGARLAPHFVLTATCTKSDTWGMRALGAPAPFRWIGWTERRALEQRIDWALSSFVVREQARPVDGIWEDGARRVTSFRDRAAFDAESRAAFERSAQIIARHVEWLDPSLDDLDLFYLPMVGDTYVSGRLARKLSSSPKLRGFQLIADHA